MNPPPETLESVRAASQRIASYAASIQQAHDLGHGPGALDKLWGREYQEKAMQVYTRTIPWNYLIDLATQFEGIAREMTRAATPQQVEHEWLVVAEYLRTTAGVILRSAPSGSACERCQIDPSTPSVMEFGRLAEIASASGAEQLRAAGTAVAEAITDLAHQNPLDQEQTHMMELLVSGLTLHEAAESLGYSVRSVQRKLRAIHSKLGVTTRPEAIAIVIANGWLKHPHRTGPRSASATPPRTSNPRQDRI